MRTSRKGNPSLFDQWKRGAILMLGFFVVTSVASIPLWIFETLSVWLALVYILVPLPIAYYHIFSWTKETLEYLER